MYSPQCGAQEQQALELIGVLKDTLRSPYQNCHRQTSLQAVCLSLAVLALLIAYAHYIMFAGKRHEKEVENKNTTNFAGCMKL